MEKNRRQTDEEMYSFMGEVRTYISQDIEIKKDYVIDRKDIYEKLEVSGNRQTKIETKQSLIVWIGSGMSIAVIGALVRTALSHFTKNPPSH